MFKRFSFFYGRGVFLCCFFIFSAVFCEDSENKTLNFKKSEFSAEILNTKITKEIANFANSGYPFVRISPKITEKEDSIFVDLIIEKGELAENIQEKFIIDGKLKEYLVKKPIEKALKKNENRYNYSNLLKVKNILENKKYVEDVIFFSPEIKDSIYEIPIEIVPFNSVLFDGGLGLATYPKTQITGRANLAVVNILGFGEVLDFSYIGEELFYRIAGDLEIPYLLATPFGLLFSASTEIADSLYGTISVSAGISYSFGDFWTAKIFAEYSEITEQDTNSRYSGIKVALENGKKKFTRSKFNSQYNLSAKSGIIYDKNTWFHKGEFLAATAFHIPFGETRFAYLTKPNLGAIAFEKPEILHKTQLFRLGGANSVRGYQESSFSALAFGELGNEFRYYITDFSAIYLLGDYAAYLNNKYSLSEVKHLFGYGLGTSIPVRKLTFSLEWARHINDFSNIGRMHFRLSNF